MRSAPIGLLGLLGLIGLTGLIGLVGSAMARPVAVDAPTAVAESVVRYSRDIQPILSDRCFECHGPDAGSRVANLRLDTPEGRLDVIVPGDPEASELWRRIVSHDLDEAMPPPTSRKRLLDARERELVRRWITDGAAHEEHWSFVAPTRPAAPALRDQAWPRNDIDRFVLARLESLDIRPSPEADRATLLRRVFLDLAGLPPTEAEFDAFLADDDERAYERVVDRLFREEPYRSRIAERLATPWLDAARYADTIGIHTDNGRQLWPYRDWVLRAFRDDLPYDRFIVEQLAGDLLPEPTIDQLVATGFNRAHVQTDEGGAIPEEYLVEYAADRAATTGTVFLGLTVSCARCHDHKYDPISQEEYFSLFAFFNSVDEPGLYSQTQNANRAYEPFLELPSDEQRLTRARLDTEIAAADSLLVATRRELRVSRSKTPEPPVDRLVHATIDAIHGTTTQRRTEAIEARKVVHTAIPRTMIMRELETPRETFVLRRGEYHSPDPSRPVSRVVPVALGALPEQAPANRLGLAQWMVDPTNPLVARVAVNRWWELLFGTGLVRTSEDFGLQGEWPSHPELLDWLAVEFREDGWSVHRLLRSFVLSATYRQSSVVRPELLETDPDNRLLAFYPRRRLEAEQIRDLALASSGLLFERFGGPSVKPAMPDGLWKEVAMPASNTRFYVRDDGDSLWRRSLYTYWKRASPPPTMLLFDAPTRESCIVRRPRTSTPLQVLAIWNDEQFVEAARTLAERLLVEHDSDEARLRSLLQRVAGRAPEGAELATLRSAVDDFRARYATRPDDARALVDATGVAPRRTELDPSEVAAWTMIVSATFSLHETLTQD